MLAFTIGPDRLVVMTLRSGRNNPPSNPGLDISFIILTAVKQFCLLLVAFFLPHSPTFKFSILIVVLRVIRATRVKLQ